MFPVPRVLGSGIPGMLSLSSTQLCLIHPTLAMTLPSPSLTIQTMLMPTYKSVASFSFSSSTPPSLHHHTRTKQHRQISTHNHLSTCHPHRHLHQPHAHIEAPRPHPQHNPPPNPPPHLRRRHPLRLPPQPPRSYFRNQARHPPKSRKELDPRPQASSTLCFGSASSAGWSTRRNA
jgi:hypothetical protein